MYRKRYPQKDKEEKQEKKEKQWSIKKFFKQDCNNLLNYSHFIFQCIKQNRFHTSQNNLRKIIISLIIYFVH